MDADFYCEMSIRDLSKVSQEEFPHISALIRSQRFLHIAPLTPHPVESRCTAGSLSCFIIIIVIIIIR
jgi:hypothetical protein